MSFQQRLVINLFVIDVTLLGFFISPLSNNLLSFINVLYLLHKYTKTYTHSNVLRTYEYTHNTLTYKYTQIQPTTQNQTNTKHINTLHNNIKTTNTQITHISQTHVYTKTQNSINLHQLHKLPATSHSSLKPNCLCETINMLRKHFGYNRLLSNTIKQLTDSFHLIHYE